MPFLFLFLAPPGSIATTYYVSSTGSDLNSGTSIAQAWATINKVNSTLFLPGDVLYFEGGKTFSGSIYINNLEANDPNNIFTISSFGTGRATINSGTSYGFYAYNTQGFSLSNLIFDGNSILTNTNAGIILSADVPGDVKFKNISISNIEIRNYYSHGMKIEGQNNLTGYQNLSISNMSVHDIVGVGILISGFSSQTLVGWPNKNVFISNCEVYNIMGFSNPASHTGDGIVVSGVDSGAIQYCVAHDNGQNNTHCGGPGGIWCWDANHFTIQYCESYRNHQGTGCDGMGFDFDGGTTNSLMQFNYAHDNDGAGFLMGQFTNARAWSNNTVRYNISENDSKTNGGSIDLFKGPGTTMSGANIYNNTIYLPHQSGNGNAAAVLFQNWTTGINNVAFYNNIFFTTSGQPFINIPTGYSAFFAGNIYWSAGGSFSISYQGTNYSSLAAWRTATANEMVGGISKGYNNDPLLSNAGFGGTVGFGNSLSSLNAYKIENTSSPAFADALDLNALYAIDVGKYDFWGTLLPGGISDNIGASQITFPLPVKLIDLHVSCFGSEQNIFWKTGLETGLKSFALMHSVDGINFSKLAEIRPTGTNSEYSYAHTGSSAGKNYYQLEMIGIDGSSAHSNIVSAECAKPGDRINVWPNPFSQSLHISIESDASCVASLAIFDIGGMQLSQKNIKLREGNNQVNYDDLANLPAGTYYLRVTRQDKVEHVKLVRLGF